MKIIGSLLTKNPCYKQNKKMTVKGLMLHSVGCNQPRASAFISNWNSASHTQSCVHGFIDGLNGVCYQTLPWTTRGWHCGIGSKGSGNNTHIGIEMCEPDCIKYTGGTTFTCSDKARAKEIVTRTYNSAVQLFAYLCKKYSLDPLKDGVIISHKEGSIRGIASNHGDPEHLWKQLDLPYTMDTFRKDVSKAINGVSTSKSSSSSSSKSKSSTSSSSSKELYRVRKTWKDASSQIGAYESLKSAKKACKTGYSVFDSNGKVIYTKSSSSKTTKLSIKEVAHKVIKGEYGNGEERKKKIEAMGYDYEKVQAEVNKLLK